MKISFRCVAVAGLLLAGYAVTPCSAQEYRATLLGVITDPSGAAVAGAKATATNIDTEVRAHTEANAEGYYVIPFLLPGKYRLRVEHDGFKSHERGPIELRVNDRTRIDVQLELGQTSERITVAAEAPLLETASSSRGQVISQRAITDLPLNGKNPFSLMNLGNGFQFTGVPQYNRPFDTSSANFSVSGGRAGVNTFLLDGVSNDANTGRANIAFAPPVEATQEFKLESNAYDAQYGRTGGGIINVSIKPGTNSFHGAAYEYLRRASLEANTFANNAAGKAKVQRVTDQYGFEVDGPVRIPKLYDGRQRTFFMVALERYREQLPQPALTTVPTAEQRQGDFSSTLTSAGRLYTIYDPLTIHRNPAFDSGKAVSLSNPQYLLTPFSGNQVPQARFDPVAVNILRDIPLPNQTGNAITHASNFFGADAASLDDYQSLIARIDHNLTSTWRMYGRWLHSLRDGARQAYNGWGTVADNNAHAGRQNDGAVLDLLGTLSPSTVLSVRVGLARWQGLVLNDVLDVSRFGWPATFTSQLQTVYRYPIVKLENYTSTGGNPPNRTASDTYTAQVLLQKTAGGHAAKFGTEFRLLRYASVGLSNAAGTYTFQRRATGSNPQVDDSSAGNAIASLLLGYMTAASVNTNAMLYYSQRYPVLFVHDDWQVTRKLTFNLGLRWDYDVPPVERFDRQNRGFDFNVGSPYQVSGLDLKGGLLFAGVDGRPRGAFDADRNNWQPRIGLAYRLANRLVFRAGTGRYFLPTTVYGGALGFSQTTDAITQTADYLPVNLISNPFPTGLIQPLGSAGGLGTQVGSAVSFTDSQRVTPNVWQYSLGFQYEARAGLLLEATYAGSQTRQIDVSRDMNHLSAEQLALGTAYLSAAVANPFYGVLSSKTSRGAQSTIQRGNLLLPFPQFTSITMDNTSLGKSWYNSLQVKVERRFQQGLSFLASYTVSKTMEATQYKNAQDASLSRELASFDVPQRLVLSGVYEFPVGPKKKWLGTGLASHIVGGWQFNWVATMQSGTPMPLPDYYIYGNPKLSQGQSLNRWFDTSSSIWVQRLPDTLRTAPFYSPNIRRHSAPQVDATLIRSFRISEGHQFQLRVSAFNLSNTPIFDFPNTTPTSTLFGVVSNTQLNLPRSVELGFRYSF